MASKEYCWDNQGMFYENPKKMLLKPYSVVQEVCIVFATHVLEG